MTPGRDRLPAISLVEKKLVNRFWDFLLYRGVPRLIKRELFFSVFDPNWLDGDKRRDKLKIVNL